MSELPAGLSIAPLRDRLKQGREALVADYRLRRQSKQTLARLCRLVDGLLLEIWQAFSLPADWLLIAVGGYGRGQLYPASDVDILILLPDDTPEEARCQLEPLIGLLWDIGLEIGHSVRSRQECIDEARLDVTVQTTLMEARRLAGNPSAFRRFQAAIHAALDPAAFFDAKFAERQQRHNRYQDVAANLEPNVKESPGGLRDLHLLLWLARAVGLPPAWTALAHAGVLTRAEAQQLARSERILENLRIALHATAKRREDRLAFEYQNALAAFFGIEATPTRRASELLMQRYFQAARQVLSLTSILTQNLRMRLYSIVRGAPQILNEHFQRRGDLLEMRTGDVFERAPAAMLEAFLLLQRHPEIKDIAAPTLRALWHSRHRIDAAFRRNPAHHALFLELFREGSGLTRALKRMNQYGILGRYIPAFGRVVGQMQHDLFHVYTVDEHILMVLRNVRRFAIPAFAHEYPLCTRLMLELPRPELLYLGALFHDIAKGRGGDHSRLGRVDARRFCRQHGLSNDDSDEVAWLVEHHLTMSQVAQKQDVYDPDVVAQFATIVGREERLTALYLLTVADIRGTSPSVWNAWKAKLLEDLFLATQRYLAGENFEPKSYVACRQREAREQLNLYAIPQGAETPLWRELDTLYFLRHKSREITWHTRALYPHVQSTQPIVRARLMENANDGLLVLVYTPDRPQLFARICHFFEHWQFSIADARIYTTRHGYALDTFTVFLPEDGGRHYRDLINLVEYELVNDLKTDGPLPPATTGRLSRQVRYFPLEPSVTLTAGERGGRYILSIVASDRPGLLSCITRVLADFAIDIHSAKISTLGERAEDTFLIGGSKLADMKTLVKLEAALLQALRT